MFLSYTLEKKRKSCENKNKESSFIVELELPGDCIVNVNILWYYCETFKA